MQGFHPHGLVEAGIRLGVGVRRRRLGTRDNAAAREPHRSTSWTKGAWRPCQDGERESEDYEFLNVQ
jgi:hypothetical protein